MRKISFMLAWMVFSILPTWADDANTIVAEDITTYAGATQVKLSVDLVNEASLSDLQFDLYLPDGFTVSKDEDDMDIIEVNSTRTTSKKHSIDYLDRTDGSVRIMCTSSKGYTFDGTSGAVVDVYIDVASTVAKGDYTVSLKNIVVSNSDENFTPANTTSTITVGDAVAPSYTEGYSLQIVPFSATAGTDNEVNVNMENLTDGEVTQVDFDMYLPAGLTLTKEDDEYVVDAGSRFASTTIKNRFACDVTDNADGSLHLSAYFTRTTSSYVFSGTSGDIMLLTLIADASMADGVYTIDLKNIKFNDDAGIKIAPYSANVYVGSTTPKNKAVDGVVTFCGNYSDDATAAIMQASMPTTDETITTVDLTGVTALPADMEITVANPNAIIITSADLALANTKNVVVGNACANLNLTDGYPFATSNDFTATNASYSRTMGTTWGTICLPYAVTSDANAAYYKITGLNAGVLSIEQYDELPAGTPALVKKLSGSEIAPSATSVAVGGDLNNVTGSVNMYGSYTNDVRVEDANSYYIYNNKFYNCNEYFICNAFRAYFTVEGGSAKVLTIGDDIVTAIDTLTNNEVEAVYDANGIRRSDIQKGMNIVKLANGKTQKIMVK